MLIGLFGLAVGTQFIGSALFHTFVCHSQRYCQRFRQLDYIGVIVHIGGLEIVTMFGMIRHDPTPSSLTLFLGGVIALVACVIVLMIALPDEKYIIYGGMVLLTLLSWYLPWRAAQLGVSITPVAVRLLAEVQLTYVAGLVVFLTKIPERWFPGLFDVWFASHQLWHIAITLATLHEVHLLVVLLEHDPQA